MKLFKSVFASLAPGLIAGAVFVAALWQPLYAATNQVKERTAVDTVWPGHPVAFALLSAGDDQYVAYYNAERDLCVAQRKIGQDEWTIQKLPTRVGWDSHNTIEMALDRDGHLHLAGNMHVTPLIYFRTTRPADVTSMERVASMTGREENQVTYPQFIKDADGSLVFIYRNGWSGRGNTYYNRYNEADKSWSRLLRQPILDGQGKMNAYPIGPMLGPDGYWHMSWVWRDTPDAETNHDLSYARSKDLVNWESAAGEPLMLPITLQSEGVIVDPIPVEGGIINGSGKIGFDDQGRVVITYHKFDENGLTQLYNARYEDGAWQKRQLTRWQYRWDFRGRGSGPSSDNAVRISHSEVRRDPVEGMVLHINHSKHGSGVWKVDSETLALGSQVPTQQLATFVPQEVSRRTSADKRMGVRTAPDRGEASDGRRYLLRWETLPVNRDRPYEGELPEPVQLEVIGLEQSAD